MGGCLGGQALPIPRGKVVPTVKAKAMSWYTWHDLYAESIVFDSYGLSPRASIDGAMVAKQIEAGASDMEIKELREEMRMTQCVTDAVLQQGSLPTSLSPSHP